MLEGKVIGRCMQRHRHQEFIRFLNAIEADIPAGKGVHVILDNYAAHKHAKVRAWLGRHERFTFHFVPTSCSWLNAVEGFFEKLSKRRLKRGVFRSIVDLQVAINRFLDETNDNPKPFIWTAESRPNHRRRQTRASSVRFDPLASGSSISLRFAWSPPFRWRQPQTQTAITALVGHQDFRNQLSNQRHGLLARHPRPQAVVVENTERHLVPTRGTLLLHERD